MVSRAACVVPREAATIGHRLSTKTESRDIPRVGQRRPDDCHESRPEPSGEGRGLRRTDGRQRPFRGMSRNMVGVWRQRSNFNADQGSAHVVRTTVTEHIRSLRAKDGFCGDQEFGIAPSFNRIEGAGVDTFRPASERVRSTLRCEAQLAASSVGRRTTRVKAPGWSSALAWMVVEISSPEAGRSRDAEGKRNCERSVSNGWPGA